MQPHPHRRQVIGQAYNPRERKLIGGVGFLVGIATFALTEIGVGFATFKWVGGYDNDMVFAAVAILSVCLSPFCLIAAVVAGTVTSYRLGTK
jgi:hypothetical protein